MDNIKSFPFDDAEEDEDEVELIDWQLPCCFTKKRHKETMQAKVPREFLNWRTREKTRTVSVLLVMCLNVGVDPPDIIKPNPAARLECWIDPATVNPQNYIEVIGKQLRSQYEKWQSKARFRILWDPTVNDVKNNCAGARRGVENERVLFHYNGHGVPRPTQNGEIWVFNQQYTQYVPLSIMDLQEWLGNPSAYVIDCNSAGMFAEKFDEFARERAEEAKRNQSRGQSRSNTHNATNYVILAACDSDETLPVSPHLPADLFTACLTTPIKVALQWYLHGQARHLLPQVTTEMVDRLPGELSDRRTPLGELNWLFTAVTDTIAWNTLPIDLFQKLFRQDLLVASFFRNFLLAERVMRGYECHPVSFPRMPPMHNHRLWAAWDFAVEACLAQLPILVKDPTKYKNSSFFSDQLTAFQVWLAMGSKEKRPPEELPIILQVLLSQVHRMRALDLLGRFLDLGPWAVNMALSVGIFPYILKLLLSPAVDLRPLLVFIWAKILAVDESCKADLVKENGSKYFLTILSDPYIMADNKTMAAFVLAQIMRNYYPGQADCHQGHLVSTSLLLLEDSHPLLRQWLSLCLGCIWTNYNDAKWCAIRDSATEKVGRLLSDAVPEVRAAAVFALGRFLIVANDGQDLTKTEDATVATKLLTVMQDGSPLVRKELVVALHHMLLKYESSFVIVASQLMEEDRARDTIQQSQDRRLAGLGLDPGPVQDAQSNRNRPLLKTSQSSNQLSTLARIGSSQTLYQAGLHLGSPSIVRQEVPLLSPRPIQENIYMRVWKAMLQLVQDPCVDVAKAAMLVADHIFKKVAALSAEKTTATSPGMAGRRSLVSLSSALLPHSHEYQVKRRLFDKGPEDDGLSLPTSGSSSNLQQQCTESVAHDRSESVDEDPSGQPPLPFQPIVSSQFYEWCCGYFAQSIMQPPDEVDSHSDQYILRELRFQRNACVRAESARVLQEVPTRFEEQVFTLKMEEVPQVLCFHPYDPHLFVADSSRVGVWRWDRPTRVSSFSNNSRPGSRISALHILNYHDISMLLTGADDGSVRVWRDVYDDQVGPPQPVTAWQAISGAPYSQAIRSGLVLSWEQQSGTLIASGDVRYVRIWDTQREMLLQDIPTGSDSYVSSLACDSVGRSLLAVGFGDGTIKVLDRRVPTSDCFKQTLGKVSGSVIRVLLPSSMEDQVVSACSSGIVHFWDVRAMQVVRQLDNQIKELTVMDMHPQAKLLACGSSSAQRIRVSTYDGSFIGNISHRDGFISSRIGPVTCLAFHPYFPFLAAGSRDNTLSLYSTSRLLSVHTEEIAC